jgi:alpha-tubulin suppressor-like RCC1 family protein
LKLVTRKSTKFQPKLKSRFRLGFKFGLGSRTNFQSFQSKLRFRYPASQTLRGSVLLTAFVLVTFLSPILKKSYEPQIANAAPPTITRLSQTISQPNGGDKIIIQGNNFSPDITFTQVSSGGNYTCALNSVGQVYCWGNNLSGQLGTGNITASAVPVPVKASDSGDALFSKAITQITAGWSHTCALDSTGKAYCWGYNGNGELGNGNSGSGTNSSVPVAVKADDPTDALYNKTITQIAAGYRHTCVLDSTGKAYCWGHNGNGQLGTGDVISSNVPVPVQSNDPGDAFYNKTITQITVGYFHTCALDSDGKAYCWGYNGSGQLGTGDTINSNIPVSVQSNDPGDAFYNKIITKISTGHSHTCALDSISRAYCWGSNDYGQLGTGDATSSSTPVFVKAGDPTDALYDKTITQITAGWRHTCALDSTGQAYCWGDNNYGELGDATNIQRIVPAIVARGEVPDGISLIGISAGYTEDGPTHTCVVGANYKVYCWGNNYNGQFGNNISGGDLFTYDLAIDSNTPVEAISSIKVRFGNALATNIRYISPYALEVTVPAHVEGTVDVTITGLDGVTVTKTNAYTYENPTTPEITSISPNQGLIYGGEEVTISGINLDNFKWKQVVSGSSHTCAIGLDNKAYCWGENNYGQLGTGDATSSSTPVFVKAGDPTDALYDKTITQITAGWYHTCALDSTGKAYCWGWNNYGQLGTGDATSSSTPVFVKADDPTDVLHGKTITQITAGWYHTCALDSTGKAYCWGWNNYGQLGTGDATSSSTPVFVKADDPTDALYDKTITQITASNNHTCALDSTGKAYCWGRNNSGQLGTGNNTSSNVPVAIKADDPTDALYSKTITQITAGWGHTCALDSTGQAYCWGENNSGQLGTGNNTSSNVPVAIKANSPSDALYGKTIMQITADGTDNTSHTCALDSTGQAYCWGKNYSGQLGTGNNTNSNVPVAVKADDPTDAFYGKTITQITAGWNHTCALDSAGQAYCWGLNNSGRLGIGNNTDSNVPLLVKLGYLIYFGGTPTNLGLYPSSNNTKLTNTELRVMTPAVSGSATVNITLHSTTTNITHNILNQAYTFTNPPAPTITQVNPNTGSVNGNSSTNIQITNLSNLKLVDDFTQITASNLHTCALDSTGKAYCWGWNSSGQLGTGNATYYSNVPVAVQSNNPTDAFYGKTITQITAGWYHTCALDSAGQAYCWGRNNSGQLGTGNTTSSNVPVAIKADDPTDALYSKTITQITAGWGHTCALDSTGQAYCWGENNYGQLGNGTSGGNQSSYDNGIDSNVPVAVKANDPTDAFYGKTITQVTAGWYHTCALDSTGKAYCWGWNSSGQLGTGNATYYSNVPVAVQSNNPTDALYGKTITQITASNLHTCALDSTGKTYCWGYNYYGQLGTGNATYYSNVPVAVQSNDPTDALYGKTITQITAGWYHTCALDSTGKTYCWGYNYYGQLGTGNATYYSNVPVAVQSNDPTDALYGKTITQITAGWYHTCALDSTGKAYCWGENYYGQLGTNQSGTDLSMQRYTPAYVMMKSDPLEVSFGTTAEHTAGTAGLATAVSSFDVPTGQYYIPGTTTLTLNTPAHSAGPVAVVVRNADGQSSSNTIAADDSNKYTYTSVPDAPTNLTANATPVTNQGINYNINLSWTAPVSDGYSPITDYLIEYCISNSSGVCNPSPEGDWTIYNDGTSTNTSTTISNLPASPSAYYTFRVSAINNIGTSQPSNTPTVQTSFITLSTSLDTINLDIAVNSIGLFSSTTHDLTVITNNPTGYNITLSMFGLNNSLTHIANPTYTISSTTANASNPQLDLPANTWGYRLNNATFGTTTTIETNAPNSQYTWAQVQPSTTPDTIHDSDDPTSTSGTTIPIYYGMKVNDAQASGAYAGTVRYTGVMK